MRSTVVGIAFGALLAGCISFDLDKRRFRCDDDPVICGEGYFCNAEGFCQRGSPSAADAGAGEICDNGIDDDDDDQIDCQDADCGAETCDDENPCTADSCEPNGVCQSEPRVGAGCGIGCVCDVDGSATEVSCGDGNDNDGDGTTDCDDPDCACLSVMRLSHPYYQASRPTTSIGPRPPRARPRGLE